MRETCLSFPEIWRKSRVSAPFHFFSRSLAPQFNIRRAVTRLPLCFQGVARRGQLGGFSRIAGYTSASTQTCRLRVSLILVVVVVVASSLALLLNTTSLLTPLSVSLSISARARRVHGRDTAWFFYTKFRGEARKRETTKTARKIETKKRNEVG